MNGKHRAVIVYTSSDVPRPLVAAKLRELAEQLSRPLEFRELEP